MPALAAERAMWLIGDKLSVIVLLELLGYMMALGGCFAFVVTS